MSIISCMKGKLPGALKNALEKEIGVEKTLIFINKLMSIIEQDSWSIWHPKTDIEQLKEALKQAAEAAGVNWSTIETVAWDVAKNIIESCLL